MNKQIQIKIKKPELRWLFGGIGFHNSEASMLSIMNDKFKNQIALKTFREISPTYSRVFAGYADWDKDAMDSFADYYDQTFRFADTTLYLVPGRLPYITKDFDEDVYAEKVANNLDYLYNERKCRKIRHYCLTNELACGNSSLIYELDKFKQMQEALYRAFKRHNLPIGLLALDATGLDPYYYQEWAIKYMDEITECYCHHFYLNHYEAGTNETYDDLHTTLNNLVQRSLTKEKRFVLGEYGIIKCNNYTGVMRSDRCAHVNHPELEAENAMQLAEIAICAINTGCYSACNWTMIDYPDPLINEQGDSLEDRKRFIATNYSGHGVNIRYNKHGLIRWSDEESDYSSYASLYTMGYMAKFFKKGSRTLFPECEDKKIRIASVTNSNGSCSIAIINWNKTEKEIRMSIEHKIAKPFRKYSYLSSNPPYNDFNDLQPYDELISVNNSECIFKIPARSMIFLTTDYVDRIPSAIKNVSYKDKVLSWDRCDDVEHVYYRVYKDGEQIASTVAERLEVEDDANYTVRSVDKYGNLSN